MQQRRADAEADGKPPHDVVGAEQIVEGAAEPGAQKGAELMGEEHHAEKHGEPFRAEERRDQAAGQREGAEPKETEAGGDDDEGDDVERHPENDQEQRGAGQIEQRQGQPLLHTFAKMGPQIGAGDIGDADDRERQGGGPGLEGLVGEEGRQMGGDEGDVKAADEEAGIEQQETLVGQRLVQGLAQGLVRAFVVDLRPACNAPGERRHQAGRRRQHQQARQPSDGADQDMGIGKRGKLADGAAHAGKPQRPAAPCGRRRAADRAEHHREARAADAEPDQHAAAEQLAAAPGIRHHDQAEHIKDGAEQHDTPGAVHVREGAGERRGEPPDQVLQPHGEREHLAAKLEMAAHRIEIEAEALADPEADRQNGAAAEDQQPEGLLPAGRAGGWCGHGLSQHL